MSRQAKKKSDWPFTEEKIIFFSRQLSTIYCFLLMMWCVHNNKICKRNRMLYVWLKPSQSSSKYRVLLMVFSSISMDECFLDLQSYFYQLYLCSKGRLYRSHIITSINLGISHTLTTEWTFQRVVWAKTYPVWSTHWVVKNKKGLIFSASTIDVKTSSLAASNHFYISWKQPWKYCT